MSMKEMVDLIGHDDLHCNIPISAQVNGTSPSVNSVTVKMIPFWRSQPEAWFLQLESQFDLAGIKSENTKFHHLLSALDESMFKEISDLVTNVPKSDPYTAFKEALISRLSLSESTKLKKLLTGLSLGDARPSQLLRDMRSLNAGQLSEAALRQTWLERLPTNTQAILACNPGTLDQLAECADKIVEVSTHRDVFAIHKAPESFSQAEHFHRKIDELTQQVSRLTQLVQDRSRSRSRGRSGSFSRSCSPAQNSSWCWYHRKFRNKAKKCENPCNFKTVQHNKDLN